MASEINQHIFTNPKANSEEVISNIENVNSILGEYISPPLCVEKFITSPTRRGLYRKFRKIYALQEKNEPIPANLLDGLYSQISDFVNEDPNNKRILLFFPWILFQIKLKEVQTRNRNNLNILKTVKSLGHYLKIVGMNL